MADRYLITFDISEGSDKDYTDVLNSVRENWKSDNISSYYRINSLTTTYAIKSDLTIRQILNVFKKATSKRIDLIVVKVIDSDWNVSEKDDDILTKHKF